MHAVPPRDCAYFAAEACDPDFADELRGEQLPVEWYENTELPALSAKFRWPWLVDRSLEVVHRAAIA